MENIVTEEAKEWPCRYSKRVLSKKKKEEGEIEGSQISFFLVLSSRSSSSSSSNTKSCVKRTYILFH